MTLPVLGVSGASSIGSLPLTGIDGRWSGSTRGGSKRSLAPYLLSCEADMSQSVSFSSPPGA
jgi:hypothetical protein